MNKIKAVIFDMDGVLFDTEPLNEQHERDYFEKIGIIFPDNYHQQLRGMHARAYWSKVINDFTLPHTVEELTIKLRKSYINFLKSQTDLKPVIGVKEFIIALRKDKFKIALASSANPKRVELLLKISKMKKLFDVIVESDNVAHGKPAPDIYLEAAKQLRLKPANCIVIEDAENGIKAGKAAGMIVVGFMGFPHNKQDLSDADKIIYSFNELTSDIIHSL